MTTALLIAAALAAAMFLVIAVPHVRWKRRRARFGPARRGTLYR